MLTSKKILGLWVDCLSMDEAVTACLEGIRGDRRPRVISTVNAALLVMARQDHRLRGALMDSELLLADGMPIFWIARALGARVKDRVTGVDLMAELLRIAGPEGLRVYFLGARPEVLARLVSKVCESEGGSDALVAGARDGYFAPDESEAIIAEIRASGADILFVALPSPQKEIWCHENREALGTPIILPVGGAFDVLSGYIRRAPVWMQVCCLEWFWRLMMDPRRKWRRYAETNPVFIGLIVQATFRRLSRSLGLLRKSSEGSREHPLITTPPEF